MRIASKQPHGAVMPGAFETFHVIPEIGNKPAWLLLQAACMAVLWFRLRAESLDSMSRLCQYRGQVCIKSSLHATHGLVLPLFADCHQVCYSQGFCGASPPVGDVALPEKRLDLELEASGVSAFEVQR